MCLSSNNPITKRVSIPGRPLSLYSGAISPSTHSQSILPASCTSSCFMLMICSSLARNRSPEPGAPCFFGRIVPSDAAKESRFADSGNPKMILQGSEASTPESLQSQKPSYVKIRLLLNGLRVVHGRLLIVAVAARCLACRNDYVRAFYETQRPAPVRCHAS